MPETISQEPDRATVLLVDTRGLFFSLGFSDKDYLFRKIRYILHTQKTFYFGVLFSNHTKMVDFGSKTNRVVRKTTVVAMK